MIRIPANAIIIGELRCDGATRVDARIEGEGHVNGVLLISKTCVWVGNITADKIIIEGTVEGQIIAREIVQLSSTAKVSGNISAPKMLIAKGARMNCDVDIAQIRIPIGLIQPATNRQVNSDILDQLAKRREATRKTA